MGENPVRITWPTLFPPTFGAVASHKHTISPLLSLIVPEQHSITLIMSESSISKRIEINVNEQITCPNAYRARNSSYIKYDYTTTNYGWYKYVLGSFIADWSSAWHAISARNEFTQIKICVHHVDIGHLGATQPMIKWAEPMASHAHSSDGRTDAGFRGDFPEA